MAFTDLIRRPLHKIAPDITEALRDPVGSLTRRPVVIGDRLLMPVIGLGLALGFTYVISDPNAKALFVRYLLIGVLLWLPIASIYWKRKVILSHDGFEYVYGRKSVFVPWSLFRRSGACLTELNYVELPIDPALIDAIEHRRDGVVTEYGIGRKNQFL